MKKLFLFVPLLIAPILSGCNSTSRDVQLTYGSLVAKEAVELSIADFETRIDNNENFLLTIYPDETSCGCWDNFERVINSVMNETELLVYKFKASDVSSSQTMKDIGGFYEIKNAPTFYIINNKSIVQSYKYNGEAPLFVKKDGFIEEVYKYCLAPKLIQVDLDLLDAKIASEKAVIMFGRETCKDCSYVIPNTLNPYFKAHELEESIYYIDLDPYRADMDYYQSLKDKYGLSTKNNPNLGFGDGVVPTFQIYENGTLKDMSVYFNDGELTLNSDGYYYATGSYYNEARLPYLHYLDNVEVKDLTKVAIKSEDVNEKHYWNKPSSAIYHDEILKGFLSTYLK